MPSEVPAPSLTLGRPFRKGGSASSRSVCSDGDAVRATDSDALGSRLAACRAGYLTPDVYAELLATEAPVPSLSIRRPPLISIGTYLRSCETDSLVQHFIDTGTIGPTDSFDGRALSSPSKVQIISLGAGSDTRFWRMGCVPKVARYIELDFPETTALKAACIQRHAPLHEALTDVHTSEHVFESSKYVLVGADIGSLATRHEWETRVGRFLDASLPTLILCECVLAYMDVSVADEMLRTCFSTLGQVSLLSYDMCVSGDREDRPHDHIAHDTEPTRFGKVMLQNLSARKLILPGARQCTTPAAYKERFEQLARSERAYSSCSAAHTLRDAWHNLDRRERARVSMLEHLDEIEELEMLLGHYCMAWIDRIIVQ